MAFGIDRLETAVNDLTQQLKTLTARVETLTSTVDTGLSETRNLINGSNSEVRQRLNDSIDQIRQDLAPRIESIRADIGRLGSTIERPTPLAPAPAPEPELGPALKTEAELEPEPDLELQPDPAHEPEPQPEPASTPTNHQTPAETEDYKKHLDALLAAASITTVRLNCHRDLWAFLVDKAANAAHFRIPADTEDLGHGRTQAALSGPSLIAALTVLWELRRDRTPGEELGAWAQAVVLYNSIAAALKALEGGARNTDDDHIDITIDLRERAADDVEADTEAEADNSDDGGSEEAHSSDN